MRKIYTLGSADPRLVLDSSKNINKKSLWQKFKFFFKKEKIVKHPCSFEVFSGMDVKAYFHFKDGTVQIVPELQAYSINIENGIVSSTLIFIVFDSSSSSLLSKTQDILFCAANEYGALGYSYLKDISIVGYKHSLSIDDLVSEEHFTLRAKEYYPWSKWQFEPKTEEGIFASFLRYKFTKQRNPAAAERLFSKEFIEKYFSEEK